MTNQCCAERGAELNRNYTASEDWPCTALAWIRTHCPLCSMLTLIAVYWLVRNEIVGRIDKMVRGLFPSPKAVHNYK